MDLVEILTENQDAIARSWTALIRQLPNSRYATLPEDELLRSTRMGISALVSAASTGSFENIDAYIENVSLRRLRQGFEIHEVVQGIMICQEAIFPFLAAQEPPHSSPGAPSLTAAYNLFELCIRTLVSRFSQRYAQTLHRSIEEQQRQTGFILEAAQASTRSLELEQVLEQVGRGIVVALDVASCKITLLDSGRSVVVEGEENCVDEADPNLVLSSFALPLEANSRLLGTVTISTYKGRNTGDCPAITPDDIELATSIAQAGALAIENARLYDETRRRLTESQALQRMISALLQNISLREVLRIVCSEASHLSGAQGSSVLLLDDDDWLTVAESTGMATTQFQRLTLDASFTGYAVRVREAMFTNTPGTAPHWAVGDIPLKNILAAPLIAKGAIIGALDVVNKPGGFTQDDIRIISLFADQAAIAIDNARLRQKVERIAVMEERNRIARELHDSVTQSLYGTTLYAEAAARLLASGDAQGAAEHLRDLRSTAQEALKEMRMLIFELRPPVLEKEGLAAALQARLDAVESRAGLDTELVITGEERFPAEIEEGFYRIAQEALNNALKHAHAHRITVTVQREDERGSLEIADDGTGFDPRAGFEKGGFGLRGMQERAAQFGGKLNIDSQPGQGTTIRVEV